MPVSLRELYPTGAPTLDQHQELLHRHARKLELGLQQDMAMNQRHTELEERVDKFEEEQDRKLDKIDREMSDQTQKLVNIELSMARRDGDTKRFQVWATLLTPILAVLATLFVNYMARPSPVPGPIHLTSEQVQQLKDNENAPKR